MFDLRIIKLLKYLIVLNFTFSIFNFQVFSQDSTSVYSLNDSTAIDTLEYDTLYTPSRFHGRITKSDGVFNFSKRDINEVNYFNMNDIIAEKLPVYTLTTGRIASNRNFRIYGNENPGYSYNGTSLSSPYHYYNPMFISPEYFENVEVLYGSQASILSENNSGFALNFQERVFNVAFPYVRFWAGEGHDDYSGADVIFAQNIAPNLNYNLGVFGNGDTEFYDNTNYEHWNFRNTLRYLLNDKTTISLNYNHNHRVYGTYGGINPDESIDSDGLFSIDPIDAVNVLTNSNRREIVDDFKLSFSNDYLLTNLYYNSSKNVLDLEDEDASDSIEIEDNVYTSNKIGTNLFYDFNWKIFQIKSAYDINYHSLNDTSMSSNSNYLNYSAFTNAIINISDNLRLRAGARYSFLFDNSLVNFGSRIEFDIDSLNHLELDFSRSEFILNRIDHGVSKFDQTLAILKYWYKTEKSKISFDLFYNSFNDGVFGSVISFEKYFELNIINSNDRFTLHFDLNYENSDLFPQTYGDFDFNYQFFLGRSNLRAGANLRFASERKSYNFDELYHLYTPGLEVQDPIIDLLNIYAHFKLGRAYLKLTYINILSSNSNYLVWYPVTRPNLRITAVWTILN